MNEPLNSQIDNNFFYKKDKGSNENAEKEVNHLISKSKRKANTIYALQIFEFVLIILCIYFSPNNFTTKDSSDKIIVYSLIFGFSIAGILILYIFMLTEIIFTDEYSLLSSKREIKGIIEVLQDYFYESPFNAFGVMKSIYDYKSWIDISGKLRIENNSAEKLYLILFIKPNIQKYDKDLKLMDIEYSISEYKINSLKYYVKIGNSEPPFFKPVYFFLFGSFGLMGIYLFYVRCYIKRQEFTVQKILNEEEDFNTMKNRIGYDKYIPGISINGKEFLFDSNLTGGNIEKLKVVPSNFTSNTAEIELKYKVQVNL